MRGAFRGTLYAGRFYADAKHYPPDFRQRMVQSMDFVAVFYPKWPKAEPKFMRQPSRSRDLFKIAAKNRFVSVKCCA